MTTSTPARPNILWICTDQQRYDTIAALGNPHIRTPALDRLCAEGVACTRAYSQSPICTPSRASFLTGGYPSRVHVNRNGNAAPPPGFVPITKRLDEAGYDCGLAGKLHIASAWAGEEARADDGYRFWAYSHGPFQEHPERNQYQAWIRARGIDLDTLFERHPKTGHHCRYRPDCPPERHQTAWCVDQAIAFLDEPRDGPWLFSLNIFDPHPPFDCPAAYADRYDPERLPAPLYRETDDATQAHLATHVFQSVHGRPGPAQQANKASYYGMIELIDAEVGRLLDALETRGLREETLVIFTSDHGEMLGDHGLTMKGCRFYEGAVRVPLLFSWPGRFAAGAQYDGLTELTDIVPTLAALTGVDPGPCDGVSLLPILAKPDTAPRHRQWVRSEFYDTINMHFPDAPERHVPAYATMYRDERYKLVVYHGNAFGELYDLEADPDEFDNLWERPDQQDVKADLLKRSFDASMLATDLGPAQVGRY